MKYLAQQIVINGQTIQGPLDPSFQTVGDVINKVVVFVFGISIIILFFVFVLGGVDILMSQGSPEKVKSGRAKITAGIIGIILMTLAFGVAKIVSYVFGLSTGIL